MNSSNWLAQLPVYVFAYLTWIALWWFLIGKFGYRGKSRLYWLIPFLFPPTEILIPISGSAFLLLLFLPWPVWGEVRKYRRLIGDRTNVNGHDLKPGQNYYVKVGDRWSMAQYHSFTMDKGKSSYRFIVNGKSVAVDLKHVRL